MPNAKSKKQSRVHKMSERNLVPNASSEVRTVFVPSLDALVFPTERDKVKIN